ncbi:MAG: hypothetical protein V4543_07575 [Bacteroidota bacterium]
MADKPIINENIIDPDSEFQKQARVLEQLTFGNNDENKRNDFLRQQNNPLLTNLSEELLEWKKAENLQSLEAFYEARESRKQQSLAKTLRIIKQTNEN